MSRSRFSPAGWVLLGAALATAGGVAAVNRPQTTKTAPAPAATPALAGWEAQVAKAEERVRSAPEDAEGYQRLAVALMAAQRETGNADLYHRAEKALLQAKQRDPKNYVTRKLLAWVLAGAHRFDEALALARDCVRENPNDYWNYGVIGDALTETGDYDGALKAVQRMVDLRPGGISYARAADQRRLHGDPEGALELYALALEATGPSEAESLAWLRTQMGDLKLSGGDLKGAGAEYDRAHQKLPGYYLALAGQAHLLAAEGKLDAAAGKYQEALKRVERPDWRAELGDVYLAMGRRDAAEAEYKAVDAYLTQRLEDPSADAGHQLAQFLADRGRSPERALALAREEAAGAKDIAACDTLAWALYHGGRHQEAWAAARQALRLGTRDPKLLYHAGMIALRVPGQRAEGEKLIRQALALNPQWHPLDASAARKALAAPAAATVASGG